MPIPTLFLDEIDPSTLPAELKKEGSDWFAAFNPKTRRVLDVSLVHTLVHERLVVLLPSASTITGIAGLITRFLCFLVSFAVLDSLRMANIWQRAAIRRRRSMIPRLAPKHGSVSSPEGVCVF